MISCSIGLLPINWLKVQEPLSYLIKWRSTVKSPCCCSVPKSCLTLCDPVDCSMPGFPLHHHFPEFVQTHIHWVGDAIQPSHPLLPSSPPALNLSQHQSLLQCVDSLPQVAKVLKLHSPTPQFKSINSSALSFLHSPTLTPIHDHWKNHSLD